MNDKWILFCFGFNLAAFLESVANRDWMWAFVLAIALAIAAVSLFGPQKPV